MADRDGHLKSGDHILQINDESLVGLGSDNVANIIRKAGKHVKLVIARDMSEEIQPIDLVSMLYIYGCLYFGCCGC